MKTIGNQKDTKSFDKLKIEEAKELYTKYLNSTNSSEKKAYLDKLILGTMYILNNYIERNNFKILQGSQYDVDDIRSAFTEIWIRKILNGDLMNVDSYAFMFNPTFFNDVYKNLVGNELGFYDQFNISADHITDLFYVYVKLKNSGKDFSFDELIEAYVKEKRRMVLGYYYPCFSTSILLLLEGIYNSLNIDKNDDLEINKHRIRDILKLLINNGIYDVIQSDYQAPDMTEDTIDNVVFENFIDDVDTVLDNERYKKIIHERFGLDGEDPKTFVTIKEDFGISSERVRQFEMRSLRKLRGSRKIKKYNIYKD